jgi:hypothetical protein
MEREYGSILMLWFTMDRPYVIEKLRPLHTPNVVEIRWTGCLLREEFFVERENIKVLWEISEQEEASHTWNSQRGDATDYYIRFSLRMKELPELLVAAEPCPIYRYIV